MCVCGANPFVVRLSNMIDITCWALEMPIDNWPPVANSIYFPNMHYIVYGWCVCDMMAETGTASGGAVGGSGAEAHLLEV